MKHFIAATVVALTISTLAYAGKTEDLSNAQDAEVKWMKSWDAGRYEQSWNEASTFFKGDITKSDSKRVYENLRLPLGGVKERKIKSWEFNNAPDGSYIDIVFESQFEKKIHPRI